MHLFIQKGLRRGSYMVSKRYRKVNNSYVPSFDSTNPNSYMLYIVAKRINGWAISHSLATGFFKWVDHQQMQQLDVALLVAKMQKMETYLRLIIRTHKSSMPRTIHIH